jgi:hypothetical protein
MFIMSILSYRTNNQYIAGIWKFSLDLILTQLKNMLHKTDKQNSYESLRVLYLNISDFPPIYNYSTVIYNKKSVGNCMENVIFQIIKLLF